VVVSGVGPATVLRGVGHEAAVIFRGCADIELRHLRVEGGRPKSPGDPNLNGALTFLGCTDVRVADCELACPDGEAKAQACLTVRSSEDGLRPNRVQVERNRIEVGAWQTGILLIDAATSYVAGNHLRVPEPPDEIGAVSINPLFLRNIAQLLLDVVAPKGPGGVRTLNLAAAEGTRFAPLAGRFATYANEKRLKTLGLAGTAARFTRSLSGAKLTLLDAGTRALMSRLSRVLRPALQGIVVAGTGLTTVQILDNLVEGTIQGVHVAASDARRPGREEAGEVMIARNIIHVFVPIQHDRERHAIFVGNTRSLHVLDTMATLTRPDAEFGQQGTAVEAVRVHGVLGPFAVVRQTSATGFAVGVAVTPLAPLPSGKARLWLVAETMAAAGAKGAVLPATVAGERNVP
jgi:hypothetical protein